MCPKPIAISHAPTGCMHTRERIQHEPPVLLPDKPEGNAVLLSIVYGRDTCADHVLVLSGDYAVVLNSSITFWTSIIANSILSLSIGDNGYLLCHRSTSTRKYIVGILSCIWLQIPIPNIVCNWYVILSTKYEQRFGIFK